jgi:Membrane proteins related to metalloendopeptidases
MAKTSQIGPLMGPFPVEPRDELGPISDCLPLRYSIRVIEKGETIFRIARESGLLVGTIESFNRIADARGIRYGTEIRIPNQDGQLYEVKEGDSVESIAARFAVPVDRLKGANPKQGLSRGCLAFIPGARMDDEELRRINGDIFTYPAEGPLESRFGDREDPFTGVERWHHGVDLGVPTGTPVRAALDGRVLETGLADPSLGNYVVISHRGGYMTYYYHLSSIRIRRGQRVAQGQQIGLSGNTGAVTGAHLHFGISRYGQYLDPTRVVGKVLRD